MALPPEPPGAMTSHGPAPGFACLMADCLGDILLVVEAATLRVVFANTRARAALGDGQGDLAGRDIRDLETELVDQAYWDEAAAGQFTATQRVETCYWREDGAMLNVEKSTYLRPWEGRDYIVVHSREVTERHEVEEELARSASQLRAALESTADGILVVSPEGGIVNLNHQFTRLWRIPEGLVAERDDAAVFTALQASLARPEEHPLREEALLSDPEAATGGTLELRDGRMLEYKSLPQYLRGHVIGRVFSFRDITAMIAHERDLVAARDLAAKASEAKSAFLAAMSHEIRTPMNGILGMTELALDTPLTALQREYLEAAHHSAEALLAIINDILDFSKIEAGRLELESTPFSPAEVLSETLRILAPRAEARRTELVLDMLSELPASVEGDPVRLRQILLNLLGNAVKFTEGGVVVLAARLGACADDGGVWLEFQVREPGSASRGTSRRASSIPSPRPTTPSPAATAGPGWDWPSAAAWWKPWMAASGWKANSARAAPSISPSACVGLKGKRPSRRCRDASHGCWWWPAILTAGPLWHAWLAGPVPSSSPPRIWLKPVRPWPRQGPTSVMSSWMKNWRMAPAVIWPESSRPALTLPTGLIWRPTAGWAERPWPRSNTC